MRKELSESMNNHKEIVSNINEFIREDFPKALAKGLTLGCLVIERNAKQGAPVDTGNLRNSITHKVEEDTGYVGTNCDYAPYVEIGTGIYSSQGTGRQDPWVYQDAKGEWHKTRGSHPHPFLKPARDEHLSDILKCFEGLI